MTKKQINHLIDELEREIVSSDLSTQKFVEVMKQIKQLREALN